MNTGVRPAVGRVETEFFHRKGKGILCMAKFDLEAIRPGMSRHWPLAVLLGFLLSAQASGNGTLSGTIVDAEDGVTPVYPVVVELRDILTADVRYAVSNQPNGAYAFSDVTPDTYILHFNAVDSADFYVDELFDEIVPCNDARCEMITPSTHLEVIDGDNTQDEDLSAGVAINGTVTSAASGQPIEGVVVRFYDTVGALVRSTVTASDGTYRSGGLFAQPHYVVVDGSSVGFTVEIHDDVSCPAGDCLVVAGNATTVDLAERSFGTVDFDLAPVPRPPVLSNCEQRDRQFRAVHLGASSVFNITSARNRDIPASYLQELKDLNVNWIGIMQSVHIDDALDSSLTFETGLAEEYNSAYTEEDLAFLIDTFQAHGFNVYVTLAIEAKLTESSDFPVQRWALGRQTNHEGSSDNWPWNLAAPGHEQFVEAFWQSYKARAVELATFVEGKGVRLFSVGTETAFLFRTRTDSLNPNHFLDELQDVVQGVREVFSGLVTYNAHHGEFRYASPTYNHIWDDLDFDLIGVSAYFDDMFPAVPTEVLDVAVVEEKIEDIFVNELLPIQRLNSNRPMIFLEGAFTNSIGAPYASHHNLGGFDSDDDGNGTRDGEEVQANLYRAMFNQINRHGIKGVFLWNYFIDATESWRQGVVNQGRIALGTRQLLGDEIVREVYREWKDEESRAVFDSSFEACLIGATP